VRFSIEGATEASLMSVRWFDRAPQPRPLVALGSGDTIEEIGAQMAVTDYLIAADLTQEERTTLDPYFEVIDQFTAHLTTHWQKCEVTVLAIRQPSVITFGTDERLRVTVSGGRSNVGNVTLPWWRFPEMDSVLNPGLERPYWAAELPVVAEMDFGRAYRLTALEVVTFRRETAPHAVSLEIWDGDTERWIRLGPAYPVTVWPKYNEQGFYEVRPMIRPWPNPVVTTRVRLLFEGSGQPRQTTAIANVFTYGDRAAE